MSGSRGLSLALFFSATYTCTYLRAGGPEAVAAPRVEAQQHAQVMQREPQHAQVMQREPQHAQVMQREPLFMSMVSEP